MIDAYGAALDFGYEVHVGDVNVEYWMNDLVPNVSILDYLLGNTNYVVPDMASFNADTNNAGVDGWGYSNPVKAFTQDPLLSWSLLDYLNKDGSFQASGSYAFIPLVNDNIPANQ